MLEDPFKEMRRAMDLVEQTMRPQVLDVEKQVLQAVEDAMRPLRELQPSIVERTRTIQDLVDKSMASSMAHHFDTVASVRRHIEMMDSAVARHLKR